MAWTPKADQLVECVRATKAFLTRRKVYRVSWVQFDSIQVTNDKGNPKLYPAKRFKLYRKTQDADVR